MDPAIFKAYDVRGVYQEQFNEEDAWKIGNAAGRFLPSLIRGFERGQSHSQTLVVGHDMRSHSPALVAKLIQGIRCAGVNVIDIGMIDTPQIYFAVNHFNTCGGIQVTASHNPAKYNGFKVSGVHATPIGIDTGLSDIKHLAVSLLHTKGNPSGTLKKINLTDDYKRHVLRFLTPNLKKLKIAVDASNGMAGKMVPLIFQDLPIDLVKLNFKHDGTFKHEPNPLVEENLAELKATIREKNCDFGLCFDGDADRLMMVDEQGKTVGCDLMTAMMVPYFLKRKPKSAVVYDLRSSRVVSEEIIKNEGTPRRERVGHSYLKKAMRDSHAVFGGELSGHFYYADNFCADSGLITLAHVLNIVSDSDKPISELIKPLRRYATTGEVNFQVEDKQGKMEELARVYNEGKVDHLDGVTVDFKEWWFNCRPSNTEPLLRLNIEAKTQELLDEKFKEIQKLLGPVV
ncbi:MAG: phosphomannomutase/phosphoglucomutase [Phycisphaerae bacterium]|nr:phosphomannomutase/phosphoglucomutase [Phycisphaerae bacterium]